MAAVECRSRALADNSGSRPPIAPAAAGRSRAGAIRGHAAGWWNVYRRWSCRSDPPSPQLAMAPDGRHLAFIASSADGRPRLWIRSFDTITARVLSGTEGAARPFWSPDGRSIGFFAGAKLKTIAATGGPVQVLCDVRSPRGGTWNQSGTIIFATGFRSALYRVAAAGGLPTQVTPTDAARQEYRTAGRNSYRMAAFFWSSMSVAISRYLPGDARLCRDGPPPRY